MVLDQGDTLEAVNLYGSVPGFVLPVPEENGSWGALWMAPADATQTVTLEATRDAASIEFVRIDGETGDAAIYEFTAATAGDRYTMTVDDQTVDPDVVAADGTVIRPTRMEKVDLPDDPYATDESSSTESDDDGVSTGLILGVAGGLGVLALVMIVVAVVGLRRGRPRY